MRKALFLFWLSSAASALPLNDSLANQPKPPQLPPMAAKAAPLARLRQAISDLTRARSAPAAGRALRSLFGEAGAERVDESEVAWDALDGELRAVQARYLSTVAGRTEPPTLERPPALAQDILARLRTDAQRRENRGWRAKLQAALDHVQGELKEKIDLRGTVAGIKKLALTEGRNFAIYAVLIEAIEDLAVPAILTVTGHPQYIPVALAFHSEPVMYPAYFAARWYFRNRRYWKIAGGRSEYGRLVDFRARLMNEDPGRRIEKVFLENFPSQSAHGIVAVNVNKSKLPLWVPLSVRNWYDASFRWYDLFISINELAVLAPSPIVRALKPYYKEHRRAGAYVLTQAILEADDETRARLTQNLAFKYWQNIGFNDLQPTLYPYLDAEERRLAEDNRGFASRFFMQASPEEARQIKTFVADLYALGAVLRGPSIDTGKALDVMAPFLPDSYPRRSLTREEWLSSPLGLARSSFLLDALLAGGRLKEGDAVRLAGEVVAVVRDGALHYVDAAAMRAAREKYGVSLAAAAEYVKAYAAARPEVFRLEGASTGRLALARELPFPSESRLLSRIYWLKQTVLPERSESLMARRGEPGRTRAAKARLSEQIRELRRLERRLDELEVFWLREYHKSRFLPKESDVPAYGDVLGRVRDIEKAAYVAAEIGKAL